MAGIIRVRPYQRKHISDIFGHIKTTEQSCSAYFVFHLKSQNVPNYLNCSKNEDTLLKVENKIGTGTPNIFSIRH